MEAVRNNKRRNQMEHYIITIGREFGSGGHKVGQIVADRLRIPYYDNELVLLATQHGGIETAMFNKYDEKKHNDYLYAVNYSGNENVQKVSPWRILYMSFKRKLS